MNKLFTSAIFMDLGLKTASTTNLVSKLKEKSPTGNTALRDAIIYGDTLMLDLYDVLMQLNNSVPWNFVHIILTDGEDTSSKSSLKSTMDAMSLLGYIIPPDMLKTWFIGVDIKEGSTADNDLEELAAAAGEHAEYESVNTADIQEIFEKVRLSLEVQNKLYFMHAPISQNVAIQGVKAQKELVLNTKQVHYVVLFTLDISGSMSGKKWKKVCDCVEEFISGLNPTDLVGAVVFNDKPELLKDKTLSSDHKAIDNKSYNNQKNTSKGLGTGRNIYNQDELAECQIFLIYY